MILFGILLSVVGVLYLGFIWALLVFLACWGPFHIRGPLFFGWCAFTLTVCGFMTSFSSPSVFPFSAIVWETVDVSVLHG